MIGDREVREPIKTDSPSTGPVVITGACGLLGSMLTADLLANDTKVIALDNLLYGGHPSLIDLAGHPNLQFLHGDVRDGLLLSKTFRKYTPKAVVHFAAIVGAPACHRDPELAAAVNVGGTANVVRALAEECPEAHLIFASTDSSYGRVEGGGPVTEDTILSPLSEYGRDKEAGERLVRGARQYTILRFATAFGLSRRLRLDLMINDFTWQAVHNRNLVIYEGGFGRTFLHVRDIVRAVRLVLDQPERVVGQTFNVGDDKLNATKEEIARLVAEVVPGTALNLMGNGTDPDQRNYNVSHTRFRNLGFEAAITIKAGIEELVKGYKMLDVRSPWRNA